MDFGVASKLWEYGINNRTRAMAEKNIDGSFAEIAAASAFQTAYAKKMAGATNFEDAFPQYDVITHVGNANISSGNWQRNDFPFWKYFDKNTSADALNDWKPEGANPSQMRSDLQRNYNSVGPGRVTVSSSEFVEARKARKAKHAEYEKLAEESALKRKMLEQEIEERYYKRNLVTQAAFNAYEKSIVEL